jgi:hypothetical protein
MFRLPPQASTAVQSPRHQAKLRTQSNEGYAVPAFEPLTYRPASVAIECRHFTRAFEVMHASELPQR